MTKSKIAELVRELDMGSEKKEISEKIMELQYRKHQIEKVRVISTGDCEERFLTAYTRERIPANGIVIKISPLIGSPEGLTEEIDEVVTRLLVIKDQLQSAIGED